MLAIVTPNPDSVAETFIRQHIRLVFPGRTAVAFFEGEGRHVADLPHLRIDRTTFRSKSQSNLSLLGSGYGGALAGEEKKTFIGFLRKNRVKAVLAEFGQVACTVYAACREAQVPLYAFFHGQDASVGGRKLKNRYSYWRMGRYASKVFVATHYFARTVQKAGISENKIHVVPYGLEVEEFVPAECRDYNLIVAVGRMVDKKAPHLTVEAFSRVLETVPTARLEMIGDGPLLGRAKDTVNKLGIEQQVIFHGARNHGFVREKVSKAGVFVQHSLTAPNGDTESLGVSLLEAMACEVPVVTTRHNGFVETVDDGTTGYLVEERDVADMARKISEIMQNRQLRDKMGRAARKRVIEHYDSKQQAKQLRKMLDL